MVDLLLFMAKMSQIVISFVGEKRRSGRSAEKP